MAPKEEVPVIEGVFSLVESQRDGAAPYQFIKIKPFHFVFGKQNGAVSSFFIWLKSIIE
jgi:hypothetical protein